MEKTSQNPQLVQAAQDLASAASSGKKWVNDNRINAQSVANEALSLLDISRRAATEARRLGQAAARRTCVGVFGPSQAGKSYLVSALAKPKEGSLLADFGQNTRDFLTEINPAGDRESTGLVTRFTAHKPNFDHDFPVQLRLLSETDLVKIFANSFFSDFDANRLNFPAPDENSVRQLLDQAKNWTKGSTSQHLDEIALYDLGDYFHRHFPTRTLYLKNASYWEHLPEIAPNLSIADRAKLYAPLWGNLEAFTQLFLQLAQALNLLGHALEANAEMGALIPRESSIVDVAILSQLGTAKDQQDQIRLKPLSTAGKAIAPLSLPRALLTALVAELTVVMQSQPYDFFDHVDLLDFPGARSRLKLDGLPVDESDRQVQVRELFLRGKIAYLFQRYTDERELSSMLLCMPPSVMEVKDLSGMVHEWIKSTHGDSPATRAQVPCALFLILTKFDLEFIEKGGETEESRLGKWDRRLHVSLSEVFGKDPWVDDWDGQPFKGIYFLRNPGLKQRHLMSYTEDGVESGISEQAKSLVQAYHHAFTQSAKVQRYFKDLETIWQAAFTPNDGGIGLLVGRLRNTLDPQLKARQIQQRIKDAAQVMAKSYGRFYYQDGDLARSQQEERLKALRLGLYKSWQSQNFAGFGLFVDHLTLRPGELRACYLNVAALKIENHAEPDVVDDDDPWAAQSPSAPKVTSSPKDRAWLFADMTINQLNLKLRSLSQESALLAALKLNAAQVDGVTNELVVAAHRLKLREKLADTLRAQVSGAGLRWEDMAERAVLIAGAMLNDFVTGLGFFTVPLKDRPRYSGKDLPQGRPIFEPVPSQTSSLDLSNQRVPRERDVFFDWGEALMGLGLANIGFTGGREIDEIQNRKLGEILKLLDGASNPKAG